MVRDCETIALAAAVRDDAVALTVEMEGDRSADTADEEMTEMMVAAVTALPVMVAEPTAIHLTATARPRAVAVAVAPAKVVAKEAMAGVMEVTDPAAAMTMAANSDAKIGMLTAHAHGHDHG